MKERAPYENKDMVNFGQILLFQTIYKLKQFLLIWSRFFEKKKSSSDFFLPHIHDFSQKIYSSAERIFNDKCYTFVIAS